MTESVQVYDGKGTLPLNPRGLYDQRWYVETRLITSDLPSLKSGCLTVDLTKPTPETIVRLEQLEQYLQDDAYILSNVTINEEDWGEMQIISVEERPQDFWIVRAKQ